MGMTHLKIINNIKPNIIPMPLFQKLCRIHNQKDLSIWKYPAIPVQH